MSHPLPSPADLQALLDQQRPATLLGLLERDDLPAALAPYQAAALLELDREAEAYDCLAAAIEALAGDERIYAEIMRAKLLLHRGEVDDAILVAEQAARSTGTAHLRAAALGWAARGLATKRCWSLAETTLREAIALAPDAMETQYAQGRVALQLDRRLDARAAYERMASRYPAHAAWGLALVAYLLGEFDVAQAQLVHALAASDECVGPLFLHAQLALATANLESLGWAIAEIERRSPQAESLPAWREILEKLRAQLAPADAPRTQLTAFPTTVQRRDHCGPCTVELVLRYWRGGLDLTNDQIAQAVMFPGGGTPIYRMREFFHLVGFDTVRCRASIGQLKRLADAGYPVIVEEEYPNSSHVAVVIGYDDADGTIIFQDPMTHIITRIPSDQVAGLRRASLDGALVAFPAGQGHDRTLALIDLFDDQSLIWLDQACLALDESRLAEASALAAQAIDRHPTYQLAWMVRLETEMRLWERARQPQTWPSGSIAARLAGDNAASTQADHARCAAVIAQAGKAMPDVACSHQFAGRLALLDRDYTQALASFRRAAELSPHDARTHAAVAEVHYALRDLPSALEAAQQATAYDPSLATANTWMARCLAEQGDARAQHYARCAVELVPHWWLAYLAQAEAQIMRGETDVALRSLGVAQSLAPARREVRVRRGVLLANLGALTDSAAELEEALTDAASLTPITAYTARQALCRILFGALFYDEASAQAEQVLALVPDDPWALQFAAAVCAEASIALGRAAGPQALEEVRERYVPALAANQGAPWIVHDYLKYVLALGGLSIAIDEADRMRASFPERGLSLIYGKLLIQNEQTQEAAAAMLDALGHAEGLGADNDLYEAIGAILDGMGVEAGAAAVLAAPDKQVSRAMRERALGLLLAERPDNAAQAREFLGRAIAANPDDPSVTLRLAMLAETGVESEALYRRALMLSPDWPYARFRLASYLCQQDRFADTLELTSGHAHDSLELMELHARALLRVGRYEEAAAAYAQTMAMAQSMPAWAYYYKWVAEDHAGQHKAAVATAQQAIERFADDPSWYVQLGQSLTNLSSYDEARQAVEQGRAAGMSERDALEVSYEIAWAQHNLSDTLEIIDQALALEPEREEGALNEWERRRLRLLIDLGRLDDARQLVHARPLSPDGMGHAAWVAMDAEHWPLLMELAEETLALDSTIFSGMFTRATALDELDREEEAIQAYHELRQTHPSEHNAYEKLGFLMALDGRADEALELADRAVALGSFCQVAWATRGYVYMVRGEDAKALDDLQAAWDRSDVDRRRSMHAFWWALNALRGEAEAASEQRARAVEQANCTTDRRHIAQIEALLAARLPQSPAEAPA